ncbi:MAG: protein kinase [Deltaproteobacteria bacterium]|nr:protein kinase [Deltaproteobacteria bacterium]
MCPWTNTLDTTVVAARYHLEREIARGGMGTVWLAHDVKLNRQVALKLMSKELTEMPAAMARFEREAQAAAQLHSTHVVQIYDFGLHGDTPFMAMELLHGESLGTRLRRVGRLPAPEAARIIGQVAKGLKAAHQLGLVHRDLKPSNIFMAQRDDGEVVKLLDFGVAKSTHHRPSDATASGVLLGTPQYMSPEQARATKEIDFRSDLWALGVVVFRMLSGVNPFRGDSVGDIVLRICSDALPRLASYAPDLGNRFDAFFARAFDRDRERRFQSAEDLAAAFGAASQSEQTSLLPVPGAPVAPAGQPYYPAPTPSGASGSVPAAASGAMATGGSGGGRSLASGPAIAVPGAPVAASGAFPSASASIGSAGGQLGLGAGSASSMSLAVPGAMTPEVAPWEARTPVSTSVAGISGLAVQRPARPPAAVLVIGGAATLLLGGLLAAALWLGAGRAGTRSSAASAGPALTSPPGAAPGAVPTSLAAATGSANEPREDDAGSDEAEEDEEPEAGATAPRAHKPAPAGKGGPAPPKPATATPPAKSANERPKWF